MEQRPTAWSVLGVFIGLSLLLGLEAWLLLSPGAILVTGMEADTLHILDGLWRIELGQRPYLDFSTPLGVLAFEALALPIRAGQTPGHAFMLANLAVAGVVVVLALWLHLTRLSAVAALGIGAVGIVIATALNFTGAEAGATTAMYYNRWGWALLILTFQILLLPPSGGRAVDAVDGIILGAVGAALMFLKATYGVAALGLFVVWLAVTWRWRCAFWSLAAGSGVALAIVVSFGGSEMVRGYLGDLLSMVRSGLRPKPGDGIGEMLARPQITVIVLAMLVAVLLTLRMGARGLAVLWVAILLAVLFVAYQNFGNYPAGALAAPFAMFWLAGRADPEARAFGAPLPTVFRVMATGLLFAMSPALLSLQGSLLAAQAIGPGRSIALLTDVGVPDIQFADERGKMTGVFPLGDAALVDRRAVRFAGEGFPGCTFGRGYEAAIVGLGATLRDHPGIAARTVLIADAVNPVWRLAGARPQTGVPIWYYRPLGAAMGDVDLLAVPVCAAAPWVRDMILDEAALAADWSIELRNPLWVVFRRVGG